MRNALSKINYIILSIGSILIITGYVLMSGEGSTPCLLYTSDAADE